MKDFIGTLLFSLALAFLAFLAGAYLKLTSRAMQSGTGSSRHGAIAWCRKFWREPVTPFTLLISARIYATKLAGLGCFDRLSIVLMWVKISYPLEYRSDGHISDTAPYLSGFEQISIL